MALAALQWLAERRSSTEGTPATQATEEERRLTGRSIK